MADYIVETERLTKCYGDRLSVSKLDLRVPEGSVYGFLGPNGAGKTTTMKLLLGLAKPTGGTIRLMGRELNEQNRLVLLRETGSLIESPSCYGHLTAQENLEIAAELKNVPKQDIDRVLAVVGLTAERNRKVKQYSLGMRQRLGIAQALLGEPKLLILDEPTNGLDPEGIHEMRNLIRNMPRLCGASVLISSHLLGEMEQTVDTVGIIDQGRLLFQGPLAELREHSRGDVSLRVLYPECLQAVLTTNGFSIEAGESGCRLPAMPDEELARLVRSIVDSGAGLVEVNRQTKSLEDIFLSLTGEGAA